MAAVSFDPLEYAEQLEAAGMPRAQAQVVAKGLTTMFIHNFDALVTKDYLDTRFSEFESKMDLRFAESESRIDARFAESESRIDARFAESESRIDLRFAEYESRTDLRFAESESHTNLRFAQLESKMDVGFARVNIILGILLVAIAIPMLQTLLTWFS